MTAFAVTVIHKVDPVQAFCARCEARAMLVDVGMLSLHEAVDELQADAERAGLVEKIGQDATQQIMAAAFAEERIVSRDGVATAGEMQADYEAALARRNADHLPSSVVAAVDWLIKNQTPEYFAQWLTMRTPQERRQIADYLDKLGKQ